MKVINAVLTLTIIAIVLIGIFLLAANTAKAEGPQKTLDQQTAIVYEHINTNDYLRGAWQELQVAKRTDYYRDNLRKGNGASIARWYSALVYPYIWHYERYGDSHSLGCIQWIIDTTIQAHDGWTDCNEKYHAPTWGYSDDSIALYNLAYATQYIGYDGAKHLLILEADAMMAEIDWIWAYPRATPRGPTEPDGLGPWAYHRHYWEHDGPATICNGNLPANEMIALDMMYSSQRITWIRESVPGRYYISRYPDFWTLDTKAEECAWKAQFLAKVYSMYPKHTTAAGWLRIAKTCAFLAVTTDESYTDDAGHTWTYARTVSDDLILRNHGWGPNHNYACSVLYSLLQAQEAMISAGLDVPYEFKHRIAGNIYSKFYKANFITGSWHNAAEGVSLQEREAYEDEMKRGYPADYRHLVGPFYLWQSMGLDVPEAELYAYLSTQDWGPEGQGIGGMLEGYAQHGAKQAVLTR